MTEPERTPQTAPDLEALPYPENEGGTHWEGCWRAPRHHNCAVREVISTRTERDATRAEVERLRDGLTQLAEWEPYFGVGARAPHVEMKDFASQWLVHSAALSTDAPPTVSAEEPAP